MSLFSFLFGEAKSTNVKREPDSIWLTNAAKLRGIRAELASKASSNSAVILLISHFQETHRELQAILAAYQGERTAIAVYADELSKNVVDELNVLNSGAIDLIVAEHHPLVQFDDKLLLEFPQSLNCQCNVSVHVSLDDKLLSVFSGDFVRDMMVRLGMKEDEKIQSRMVERRIRSVQQKITQSTLKHTPTKSMVEWYELNLEASNK